MLYLPKGDRVTPEYERRLLRYGVIILLVALAIMIGVTALSGPVAAM